MADHWARRSPTSPAMARKMFPAVPLTPSSSNMNGSSSTSGSGFNHQGPVIQQQQQHTSPPQRQQQRAQGHSHHSSQQRQSSSSTSPTAATHGDTFGGAGGQGWLPPPAAPSLFSSADQHSASASGGFSLPQAHSEPVSPVRHAPQPLSSAASPSLAQQEGAPNFAPRTGRSRSLRASGGRKREGVLTRQRSLRSQRDLDPEAFGANGLVATAAGVGAGDSTGLVRLGSTALGLNRGPRFQGDLRRQRPPSGKLSPLLHHHAEADQTPSSGTSSPALVLSPITPPSGGPRLSRPPSQLSGRMSNTSNASNSPAPLILLSGAMAPQEEATPPSPSITFTTPDGQKDSPLTGGAATSPLQHASTPGGERPKSRSPVPWQPRPPSRSVPRPLGLSTGRPGGGDGGGGHLTTGHSSGSLGRSITPDTLESMRSMALSPTLGEMEIEECGPAAQLSSSAGAALISEGRGPIRPLPRRRSISGASRPPRIAEDSGTPAAFRGDETITLRNGTTGSREASGKIERAGGHWLRGTANVAAMDGGPPIFGAYSMGGGFAGTPKENQDNYFVFVQDRTKNVVAGVMDGHGLHGAKVSAFIKLDIGPRLLAVQRSGEDPTVGISSAIRETAKSLDHTAIDARESGSTLVLVSRSGPQLHIANVGDSRCVLGRRTSFERYQAVPLTVDHKPSDKAERDRIHRIGGFVEPTRVPGHGFQGPARVWSVRQAAGGLAISRSMGDTLLACAGVRPDPDLSTLNICKDDAFLILASDGVWDHVTNEMAVKLVAQYTDPRQAAQALVKAARRRWISEGRGYIDDVTAVVVML